MATTIYLRLEGVHVSSRDRQSQDWISNDYFFLVWPLESGHLRRGPSVTCISIQGPPSTR
jgi:hypothetical protein